MNRKILKQFVLAAMCVTGMAVWGKAVYAAEAEYGLEDALPQENVAMGVLVVENDGNLGIVDVYCDSMLQSVSCDYSELEVPSNAECKLEIHPFSGYEVESVLINDILAENRDGKYVVSLKDGFVMVKVKYKAAANAGLPEDNEKTEQESGNKVCNPTYEKGEASGGETSVSAISYDVKVTYLKIDSTEESVNPGNGSGGANGGVKDGEITEISPNHSYKKEGESTAASDLQKTDITAKTDARTSIETENKTQKNIKSTARNNTKDNSEKESKKEKSKKGKIEHKAKEKTDKEGIGEEKTKAIPLLASNGQEKTDAENSVYVQLSEATYDADSKNKNKLYVFNFLKKYHKVWVISGVIILGGVVIGVHKFMEKNR